MTEPPERKALRNLLVKLKAKSLSSESALRDARACAGHSLKEVTKHIGLGVIEITPSDARIPGTLAGAATVLAKNNISIRQVIVDDPELSPDPKLTLITEKKIPGELISEVLKIEGVVKVSLY